MAIDFPNSPTNGQTFTVGDTTWTYDGSKWNKNAVTISGPTGPNPLVIQPGTPSATNVLWLDTDAVSTNAGIPVSVVDAKGDLIVGSAADAVARLGVGSNGDLLVADSTATNGVRWQGQTNTGRNLLINGAMQVAQRGTSASAVLTGYHTVDRWQIAGDGAQRFTFSVESDGPTGSGFAKSAKLLVSTANASPTSAQYQFFQQSLEGQDLQRIKKGSSSAEQLSFSFWVKSNVTGTYIIELVDTDNSRSVSASYSVSSSATWEKKTITFPADTTGVFTNDNNDSLRILFWLVAGSNYVNAPLQTSWGGAFGGNRATGQVNLTSANNNYWQITGVQLETGPVATAFDFEPYETTFRKCQRYFQKWKYAQTNEVVGVLGYTPGNYYYGATSLDTPMRTTPATTLTSATFRKASDASVATATLVYFAATSDGVYWCFAASNGGLHATDFFINMSNASAEL